MSDAILERTNGGRAELMEGALSELVAVTGGDGFIGSHLVEALHSRGFRVRAMAQYNPLGTWGWLDGLSAEALHGVEVILGDVRDARSVRELLDEATVAYHLAALIGIPYSYRAPRSYLDTNATGTLNVLEAARDLGTPRVIHTSTSEVYGTAQTVPISESHPLQAQSPYAASKLAADKLAESYHRSFELPVVTLRPFNTYGPRQSARAVIPTIITQLAAGEHRLSLGMLSPTRDFNYVADTVEAFLAVGTAPSEAVIGRVLNAGSGTETSIADVVRMIGDIAGVEPFVSEDAERVRPPKSEVMRLVCDATALRDATGWMPRVPLQSGLEATYEWFSDPRNLGRYQQDRYTV